MKRLVNLPFLFTISVLCLSFSLLPKNSTVEDAKLVSHASFNTLLSKNVTASGVVSYKGFKNNPAFNSYLKTLSAAQPINTNWSKNDKLAFWINTYNAFTIKLINDNWPIKSIRDIKDPWKQKFIVIGGKTYDLNSIEHEILRKMKEPRIHFAIVCASYSCPKLLNEAYTATKLEAQLLKQTKAFVNDVKRNKITANKAELSELFNWFKSDFTANGSLIDYINKYTVNKINKDASISHLTYDWSLNNK